MRNPLSRRPPEQRQPSPAEIASAFHALYYDKIDTTWQNTFWLGVPTSKCPLDLWIYQEILTTLRPDLIVESGTYRGGSALFLATVCDALGRGNILTIDIRKLENPPVHPRIRYLEGSSLSDDVIAQVRRAASGADTVLVILDSDHSREHVCQELEAYAPIVSEGSYLVVEDTNVNGHPVRPDFGPGPAEAARDFLATHPEFAVDHSREKFLLTFNPGGYLRRHSGGG